MDDREFYGSDQSFLFVLAPTVKVYKAGGPGNNFMYLHTGDRHGVLNPYHNMVPHGLAFGGTLEEPRLFIPESLEHCTAGYIDATYEEGNLLPSEALERFEIAVVEIWAIGGEKSIEKGLQARMKYRDMQDTTIDRARHVGDKSWLADDMKEGIYGDSKLFSHREETRGRHEFVVDDQHGGYKLVH